MNKLKKQFQNSWKVSLSEKFRNARRIFRKRQKKEENIVDTSIKLEKESVTQEDEVAINEHKKWMISESKKKHKNEDQVEIFLNLTFEDRRQMIRMKKLVKEIKEEYPLLFSPKQVIISLIILTVCHSFILFYNLNFIFYLFS